MLFDRQRGPRREEREGVEVATKDHRDRDTLNRAKALAMLNLQRSDMSLREIGKFFGVSHQTVKNWIAAIPPEAKRRHASPLA